MEFSAETLALGTETYLRYCAICHGAYAVSSGVAPDLRRMTPETHDVFNEIVLNGLYEEKGMIGFGKWIDEEEANAIHAYVVERSNLSRAFLAAMEAAAQ